MHAFVKGRHGGPRHVSNLKAALLDALRPRLSGFATRTANGYADGRLDCVRLRQSALRTKDWKPGVFQNKEFWNSAHYEG